MFNYLLSKGVAFLQRFCRHPMVTYDMLEGDAYKSDIAINYCRSCGAVRAVCSADSDEVEMPWRLVVPDRFNSIAAYRRSV